MHSTLTCKPKPQDGVPCEVFEAGTYISVHNREYLGSLGILTLIKDMDKPRKAVVYLMNGTYDWADEVTGLALPSGSQLTIEANQYK